jgi:hypothetical protein
VRTSSEKNRALLTTLVKDKLRILKLKIFNEKNIENEKEHSFISGSRILL